MLYLRRTLSLGLLATALGLAACSSSGPAATYTYAAFTARLYSGSEVPPNTSPATGTLDASLNKATNMLTWTITYSGLTGPATAAHFHGPASMGANAGVVVPITGSVASPITGSATLTPAQSADLQAGRWYFNVHTAANPGGEIRGQVIPQM